MLRWQSLGKQWHHSPLNIYRQDGFPNDRAKRSYPFNGPLSRTIRVSQYQKCNTSERQLHQLGHMQVYTSLQTDNHASTSPLSFLQARCPSCHPTNSVKALKATNIRVNISIYSKKNYTHGQTRWKDNDTGPIYCIDLRRHRQLVLTLIHDTLLV